jgi:hypothetical protein
MIPTLTGALGIAIAVLIIFLVRRDRLHVHHGMGWILVAAGFALLGFAPGIVDRIALFFGIGYPPVLALSVAIALLVVKILLMDIERSRVAMRNQRLIQRVAMLEEEVRASAQNIKRPDQSPSDQDYRNQ